MRNKFLGIVLIFFILNSIKADESEIIVKEGNQLFSSGEFEKAKIKYLASLEEKKNDPSILYNLGNVEFKLMKFQESQNYYLEAIKQKPNDYLLRNLYYHLGNTQQALAHENMQEKKVEEINWGEIVSEISSVELSNADNDQRVLFKKITSELKNSVKAKEFEKAKKCFSDLEDFSTKFKDQNLSKAVLNAQKYFNSNKDEAKVNKIEEQIAKVKKSISGYEEAFQSFRKSLEVSRKIAIKEGRDIAEVGNYIKNNWAIGRERWSLLYEELNRLMKENLKLKEGVAELIQIQSELFNRLEQMYLKSQQVEVLEYNLKVLAEFHTDYKKDIVLLEKIADEELKTKKTELENLKATQKQAQGNNAEKEPISYEKEELEIKNAERISDGLRNVEGFENFIEDGLKKGDLFNVRRNSFQMLVFLKSLNDYLNKNSPIDRTFVEIQNQLNDIDQSLKEIKEIAPSPEVKDTLEDVQFKKSKIVHEKFIDIEYMLEQLANYLNDYVKEGSLTRKSPVENETAESKWMLETLNLFAKTALNKLEKDIKLTQEDSVKIREKLSLKFLDDAIFSAYKGKNNKHYASYKNTLLGFVEGVQSGINRLTSLDLSFDTIPEKDFFELLYDKLVFLTKEMEKENTPEAFKHVLPIINQKLQGVKEKYAVIFDIKQNKEKRLSAVIELQDDFSKIIFYIDPIKTMNFKFQQLLDANSQLFNQQEEAVGKKDIVVSKMAEIKSNFDILINSLAQQNTKIPEKDDKENNEKMNKEELLQDWKKSLSIFNLFELSLKTIDFKLINSYEMYRNLHKIYTSGLQLSALRFQNEPKNAMGTLKLAIEMQEIQKNVSNEMVDKRWKDLIDKDSLDAIKNFQQELIEMIGVRGINLVLKMKEESSKDGEKASAPSPSGTPSQKIDFDAAIEFMKVALTEGDKINSFYEVREFANTIEKHDKMIEALQKALEILNQKESKDDKNKDENKQDQQKNDQKAEAAPQENNKDESKSEKGKSEKKPLELTPEQARQLLNDLNKKDESKRKSEGNKTPIKTPRPW